MVMICWSITRFLSFIIFCLRPDVAGWSFLGDTATYKLLVWAFGATNKMYTSHTQTAQDRSLIPAMTSLVMGQGSLAKNGKFVCDPEKLPHMNVT